MSAFRLASDFNEADCIPERRTGPRSPATRNGNRQDCERDRRSWRIAICGCDAVTHNFVAFSRKPLLRPLESSYKLSPRVLELEMHSAVLRFTFCDEVQCPRVSRDLAACPGLPIPGRRRYW